MADDPKNTKEALSAVIMDYIDPTKAWVDKTDPNKLSQKEDAQKKASIRAYDAHFGYGILANRIESGEPAQGVLKQTFKDDAQVVQSVEKKVNAWVENVSKEPDKKKAFAKLAEEISGAGLSTFKTEEKQELAKALEQKFDALKDTKGQTFAWSNTPVPATAAPATPTKDATQATIDGHRPHVEKLGQILGVDLQLKHEGLAQDGPDGKTYAIFKAKDKKTADELATKIAGIRDKAGISKDKLGVRPGLMDDQYVYIEVTNIDKSNQEQIFKALEGQEKEFKSVLKDQTVVPKQSASQQTPRAKKPKEITDYLNDNKGMGIMGLIGMLVGALLGGEIGALVGLLLGGGMGAMADGKNGMFGLDMGQAPTQGGRQKPNVAGQHQQQNRGQNNQRRHNGHHTSNDAPDMENAIKQVQATMQPSDIKISLTNASPDFKPRPNTPTVAGGSGPALS